MRTWKLSFEKAALKQIYDGNLVPGGRVSEVRRLRGFSVAKDNQIRIPPDQMSSWVDGVYVDVI